MKWVRANNDNPTENFELWEENKKLVQITFSKYTRFARTVSKLGRRIFAFEKSGLFSPKKYIENEYGVKMGKVEEIKPGAGKGFIELDDIKYYFELDQHQSGEVKIYDELKHNKLLNCSFGVLAKGFTETKSLVDSRFTSLLLVLCWYAFQPHNASSFSGSVRATDLMLP